MPATFKVTKQIKPLQAAPSRSIHPDTPPDSPTWQSGVLDIATQFLGILKSIQAAESKESSFTGPHVEVNTKPAEAEARAAAGYKFPMDTVELLAQFTVWAASPEAEFTKGKYLWVNWDVDEIKTKREEFLDPSFMGLVQSHLLAGT
jgi:hypothetical protein